MNEEIEASAKALDEMSQAEKSADYMARLAKIGTGVGVGAGAGATYEGLFTYAFDFKHFTPNKVPRVTTWSFDNDREPASMIDTELYSGLLVGQKDGGIAGYEGYFDTDLAWVSSAASY